MSPAYICYLHRVPAFSVMVSEVIGNTTHTSLIQIECNLDTDRYILTTYVLWLWPILGACQTPFFNKIMQDHMSHVML